MAGFLTYMALIAASATGAFPQAISPAAQDVIRIANVCVVIRPGYDYAVTSNIDYFQVNVTHAGVQAHVYIGYNPKLLDENRKWQSHALRATVTESKVVPLEGAQAGQFLGVAASERDRYFHLWFDGGDRPEAGSIKEVVGFCA